MEEERSSEKGGAAARLALLESDGLGVGEESMARPVTIRIGQ